MRTLAYHLEKNLIVNSDGDYMSGEVDDVNAYLAFLLEPKPDTIKVVDNVDYAIAQLLRTIRMDESGAQILWDHKQLYDKWTNYGIDYIPGKYFAVKFGKHKGREYAHFSNTSQYKEVTDEKAAQAHSKGQAYKIAVETRKRGDEVYRALRLLELAPTVLTSPIRCYERDVLSHLDLPTVDDMPDEVVEMAYECCHRAWVEAFKLGEFDGWDYDINSAYPSELANLLDLRGGFWVETILIPSTAQYGFARGKVTINSDFSPVMKEWYGPDRMLFTPQENWETTLTMQEVRFIDKWKLGTFEPYEAWYWTPDLTLEQSYPFSDMIADLNAFKARASGLQREVAKLIMNGIYGKLLEIRDEQFGMLFNPIYASTVETNTRLKVAQFCLENDTRPLHVAVDGCIMDRHISLPVHNGKLGQWRCTTSGKVLIAGSGTVGMSGKDVSEDDFSLNYSKLRELLETNLDDMTAQLSQSSFVSLGKALNENKYDKLGIIEQATRTIDISAENKRFYAKIPVTCRDLLENQYESQPWPVHFLEGMPI